MKTTVFDKAVTLILKCKFVPAETLDIGVVTSGVVPGIVVGGPV